MSLKNFPGFLLNSFEGEMNGNTRESYRFRSFLLDIRERQLLQNGIAIQLSPKSFDVLSLLVRRAGHLVKKEELMQSVWPEAFVEEANASRVIHTLRRVLGEDQNDNKFIETVPKKGYRFVAEVERAKENVAGHPMNADDGSTVTNEKKANKRLRLFLVAGVISGAVLLISLLILNRQTPMVVESEQIDSIAVLPFENATQDPNLEYLSDGITENIINALSIVPDLRVTPRGLAFKYKNAAHDLQEIGKELRVQTVVTGKIARFGDQLVVQTELINIDKKTQIWGGQYSHNLSAIFESQNLIVKDVVTNLRLKVSESQQQTLSAKYTENADAQKAFLNGLYLYNQSAHQSQNVAIAMAARKSYCEKSVEYFQRAIKSDPKYAQAYANMARSYRCLAVGQFSEYHEKAREAALTAIKLDETNDMAHRVLAAILRQQDWNWAEAEREFKRAIELNPNESGDARQGYAMLLSGQGRHEEAIQQIELVEQRFPETMLDNAWAGFIYKDARLYDVAMEKFRRIKEIRPENTLARFGLSEVYALKGMDAEAVAEAREIVALTNGIPGAEMFMAAILAKCGQRREAMTYLAEYEKEYEKQSYPLSILIASTYAKLGDKDRAFYWLEKSYAERSVDLIRGLKVSPAWDELREDPRYFDLLRRIGLS